MRTPNRYKFRFFLRIIKKMSKNQTKEMIELIDAMANYCSYDPDDLGTWEEKALELLHEFEEFDHAAMHRRGQRLSLQELAKAYNVPYYMIRRGLEQWAEEKGKTLANYVGTMGGKYVYVIPKAQYNEFLKFLSQYIVQNKRRGKTYAEFLKENGIKVGGTAE